MAAFINNDITTAGLIVLAKGVAGQKINYTKIVLGDGYLEEGQTPRTLTGVVSPKATVDITKLKINGDGTVAVGGIFTNGDETEGFYYRELGLYWAKMAAGVKNQTAKWYKTDKERAAKLDAQKRHQ